MVEHGRPVLMAGRLVRWAAVPVVVVQPMPPLTVVVVVALSVLSTLASLVSMVVVAAETVRRLGSTPAKAVGVALEPEAVGEGAV